MGGGGSALGGATVGRYGDGGAGIVSFTVLFMYCHSVWAVVPLGACANVTRMLHSCTCQHVWQCFGHCNTCWGY